MTVECHAPYFVSTKMSKIRHASLFTPSPNAYAAASLGALGGAPSVVPYWPHALQDAALRAAPEFVQAAVVTSMHVDIRRRAMKKEERAAKGE